MSDKKEYIVSLNRNVNYDQFWAEMENSTNGLISIPNRAVEIVNNRDASLRICHYSLTDEEAEKLRKDPRVYDVEIPPEQRNDIVIQRRAIQNSDFTKTDSDSGSFVNWGLRRMIAESNPYSGSNVTGGFNYTLDGTGVDIVIQDSGIQSDHPEFQDANGNSRVQEIDWFEASGLPGTMPEDHYTDYDGHGTHVAGITAGRTYGWAKNARIYAVKVNGLQGSEDPNGGISVANCFDVIKAWHASKPVDPATGVKRPTIVNMSWGYSAFYSTVSSMVYRGTVYSGTQIDTSSERWALGLVPLSTGFSFKTNIRISSVDVDIQELIDAGVHVVIAAGNNYHKIDVVGGVDYNNYAVTNNGIIFYHRGSSPMDDQAIKVGNIDSLTHSGGLEQANESSEKGPGVDIWAPGTDVMSACSNVNAFDGQSYYRDENFKQTNISGTSMAAPQVAGLGALYLQLNPETTPAQLKTWLQSQAKTTAIYSTGLVNDYTNTRSLLGSGNRFAFQPYNSPIQLRISGS